MLERFFFLDDVDRFEHQVFKTLHVLTFVDDPAYRREMKAMRNLNEGRHDLARHIFHGRKGELHQAYRTGQEDQLGALGLGPGGPMAVDPALSRNRLVGGL